MAEIVEFLFDRSQRHEAQIGADSSRTQKLVEDSVRRVDEKVSSYLDSSNTTMHSFFKQTNEKVSKIESDHNMFQLEATNRMDEMGRELGKRVSEQGLKVVLDGHENKIKKEMEGALKSDHMQRLSTVNDVKTAFKEVERELELKNKMVSAKLQELAEKYKL